MFNKLSTRFIFTLLLVGLIPLGGFFYIIQYVIPQNMLELENKNASDDTYHIKQHLYSHGEALLKTTVDYAAWDETYQQIHTKDPDWINKHIISSFSQEFNCDLVILTDNYGEIMGSLNNSKRYTGNLNNLPEFARCLNGEKINGLMGLDDELYLITGAPVLKSDESGPINGVLLTGQRIDDPWLKKFNKYFDQEIGYWWKNNILIPDESKFSDDIKTINFSPKKIQDGLYIYRTPSFMTTFFPVYDIEGQIISYFMVSQDCDFFISKSANLKGFLNAFFLISLTLVIFIGYLLISTTLGPIKSLQSLVNTVKEKKKPVEFNITGAKEILELSESVNEMAIALEEQAVLQRENEVLTLLSNKDGLTNLYNHKCFHNKLKSLIDSGEKNISLIMLDVDNFKYYNDLLGHIKGDNLLKNVGEIITQHTPQESIIARYGGDDFGVILPGYSMPQATKIAQDIQKGIEKYTFPQKHKMPGKKVTISAGIATYPDPASNIDELIKLADQQLYNTKNFSQNKIGQYFSVFTNLQKDINSSTEELTKFAKMMLIMINHKDKYTFYHTKQVVKFSKAIGKDLGLSPQELNFLTLGALLHDIGKLEVDKEVLNKTTPLTEAEWQMIQQHAVWGAQMLSPVEGINEVELLVRHHHERYDGKGYPDNLSGKDIPLGARIIAVADSFDAMTTHRPYRKSKTIPEALLELEKNSGTQFDPEIVKAFRAIINEVI